MENFYKFGKVFFILLLFFCTLSVNALEFQEIDYKDLNDGAKIHFENGVWTEKVGKKSTDYFVKKSSGGVFDYSEFYSPDDKFMFSTGTQYEFIYKGSLIGYSNSDLKFYEFEIKDNLLSQRELDAEEVANLFPKFKVIRISDFSKNTNSLKVKRKGRNIKILLYNDTDRYFNNYSFTSNNAKFENYSLKGFIEVKKKGMLQFSKFGENTKSSPWYVILVR